MDTTKAARYEEIVAGFTQEELRRLPLAVEYCATLEEFLKVAGQTVNIDPPISKIGDFGIELNLLMDEELRLMELKPRGFFARRREEERRVMIAEIAEKRSAVFEAIQQEVRFIQGSLELYKLIHFAQVERMMETMGNDELGLARKIYVKAQASSIGRLNDAIAARNESIFQNLNVDYQTHLTDVLIGQARQFAIDMGSSSR